MTTRLPPDLQTEATAYAAKLGISVNALLAVALRDYLDARRMHRSGKPSLPPSYTDLAQAPCPPEQPAPSPAGAFKAPKSRSDPCPCGAKNADGYPLKWKQCHGRP